MKDDRLLYQQTIDKIYELIDSGGVKPGERFPPETTHPTMGNK